MNKENISALWDSATPKLYGYLVNTLRDRNLAEDILQTTWMKAIEALPRYQESGAGFSAWLFAIARNECRQYWRTRGREVPLDLDIHDTKEADSKNEDQILVDQILGQLSSSDQELLRMRYIAGLTLNEIAAILKINPIALRVRMHRATKAARDTVKNQSI